MALYELSESVRLVPYYANLLGGIAEPNEDGELKKDELMLEDGQPRVFNMPVGGDNVLVYTEAGDLDSLSDEKKDEYDRIVFSPFKQHYEQLEKRELSNLNGEYKAVRKLEDKKREESSKPAPRRAPANNREAQPK